MRIVFADSRIVVVDKPAGLLSVPGIGPERADCVAARVAALWPSARIVHRLDQATSGLLVLALDAEAHRALGRQFEQRRVEKLYVAVVDGALEPPEGVIDLPMRTDIDNRPHQIVDHVHGRRAITRYEVVQRDGPRTRVELRPITGRSHQLRVHMAALGHPILGDDLYAPPRVRDAAPRLVLHALRLAFEHPGSGERVSFEAPSPL